MDVRVGPRRTGARHSLDCRLAASPGLDRAAEAQSRPRSTKGEPMPTKFEAFAALHVPGDPVILYNVWDVGSAQAVIRAGAKALATGSHPVADANGWPDAEGVPIDFALANAKRIAGSTELPVTVDFEGAYSDDPDQGAENVVRLAATGAVGDQFFINARTDLYLQAETHDSALVDEAIERGKAFADAGANGFFVPRLADAQQVERIVKEVPLPLNLIAFPGAPPKAEWANAGVARISHGPHPHRALMAKFEEMARAAIA